MKRDRPIAILCKDIKEGLNYIRNNVEEIRIITWTHRVAVGQSGQEYHLVWDTVHLHGMEFYSFLETDSFEAFNSDYKDIRNLALTRIR